VTKDARIATQEAAEPKLGPSYFGSGACFLDYDGDGKIDLFLPDNGQKGMTLYHNLGNGKFEDVTEKSGFNPTLHGIGCTAGDYDNDGATDLVVTSTDRVFLFHNEKNGTFKDVAESAGIKSTQNNFGATFVDYDHDGDLDLFIARACPTGRLGGCGNPHASGTIAFDGIPYPFDFSWSGSLVFRNNGNGTFTDVTDQVGLKGYGPILSAIGSDFNNDRAVDIIVAGATPRHVAPAKSLQLGPAIFENPREGKFNPLDTTPTVLTSAVTALDFDHDGWMDLAFTGFIPPAVGIWRNEGGKSVHPVNLPDVNLAHAYGVAAFDYDNDGWVDLVAVGETKVPVGVINEHKFEIRLFRNLGPDGWKDVTADVGLDKIQLKDPRAIITGDYDNDGATDLLITQNHGPAVLLKNEGGNKNNWLRLALKGLNENKSAIGTKVELFSDGIRQTFKIYGSNG
jgi:hypothetical protein